MCDEVAKVYFEVTSWYLHGQTVENHEIFQSRQPVSGPCFGPGTYGMLSRTANHHSTENFDSIIKKFSSQKSKQV
jgi:hypothetical protein